MHNTKAQGFSNGGFLGEGEVSGKERFLLREVFEMWGILRGFDPLDDSLFLDFGFY